MKLEMQESPPRCGYIGEQSMPSVGLSQKLQTPAPLASHTKRTSFFSIDQILAKKEEPIEDEVFAEEDRVSTESEDIYKDVNASDVEDIEKVEMLTDGSDKDSGTDSKNDKQTPSYTSIIAQAILSSSEKKLPLGCIYDYIAEHFPQFLKKGQGWRNCVRHNLSLSECFVKAGRARNGRGNYWGIHPRYIKNFSKGDFRKRRASHRPRNRDFGYMAGRYLPQYYNPYVLPPSFPKQHVAAPLRTFTVENILRSESIERGPPALISSFKPWVRIAPFDDGVSKYPSHPTKYHMLSSSPSLPSLTPTQDYYSYHQRISPNLKGYDFNGKDVCSCRNRCCQPTTS